MERGRQPLESSQLIDIAAMSALVQPEAHVPPMPPTPIDVAPNFAASRLTTGSVAEVLAGEPRPRPADPRAPLYWMIGCLNVLVLALAAYVVFDEPQVVVHKQAAAAPVADVEVAAAAEPKETRTPEPPREEPAAVPGSPQPAEAQEPNEPSKRRTTNRRRGRSEAAPAPKKAEPAKTPIKKSSDVPFDCIVDPASCGRGVKNTPRTEAQGPKRNKPAEDLPDGLSQPALRAGFGKVRAAAKACGPKYAAAKGSRVEVKISIAGKTGQVTSAKPLGSHARTGLGSCVASALKRASFDRFAKRAIGIKYTVRL